MGSPFQVGSSDSNGLTAAAISIEECGMQRRVTLARWSAGGRRLVVLTLLIGLAVGMIAPGGSVVLARQDDATPDAEAEPLIIDDSEEGTPSAVDGASLIEDAPAPEDDAVTEESVGPEAAIAQGLVFLDGASRVWQVREIAPASASDATPYTAPPGFLLQRVGDTIIRNDLSGKRAKLEPGEAYFTSAGDPYTAYAGGASAVAWGVELVEPSAVAGDAFYESPIIEGLPQGTFDLELIRIPVNAGDAVELPPHNGPALVLVTTGTIDIEVEGSTGTLNEGDGQVVPAAGSVQNDGADPAVFVFAALGDQVDDEGPAAELAMPTPAAQADQPAEDDEAATPEESAGTTEEEPASDDTATDEEPASDGTAGDDQAGLTSIAVTADAPIYVEVVADGETAFAGELDTGQTTGQIAGANFEVYTTSGVSTVFTNACGDTFMMGFEEGEVTYALSVNEESCPPA